MLKSNTFKKNKLPETVKLAVPRAVKRIGIERIVDLSNEKDNVAIPMEFGYITWTRTYIGADGKTATAIIDVSDGEGTTQAKIVSEQHIDDNDTDTAEAMKQALIEAVEAIG